MSYPSLRDFLRDLERRGELKRVPFPVDPRLEMTELCRRSLRGQGPALLFEHPRGHDMPVLGNLFGTTGRVAAALGYDSVARLREVGSVLAFLKEPQWPTRWADMFEHLPDFAPLLKATPRTLAHPPCCEIVQTGADVDITRLPVWTCWPDDAGSLITWGLVVHPRRASCAAERGGVSTAGARPQSRHHALAAASRRRARLPRLQAEAS